MADTVRVAGEARLLGPGQARPVEGGMILQPVALACEADGFTFAIGDAPAHRAAYRDLSLVAVQRGVVLLVVGEPGNEVRLLVEHLGQHLGTLVQVLRDRRLRQQLADRFVEVPPAEAIELVEYRAAGDAGVGQLALHPGGVVLAPLDERRPWITIHRADIGRVEVDASTGSLGVVGGAGGAGFELVGLGDRARGLRDRLTVLREGAAADAVALVAGLIPDAPFVVRDRAAALLVDGRPCAPAELGEAWQPLESAVLAVPAFAASYRALLGRAGGSAALRWLALAPDAPGSDALRAWFFVGLPGNLVAMELVSEGAHATYCFRVVPRSTCAGQSPTSMRPHLEVAVQQISGALVDARFLREPIGLPDDQLALPAYARYRLALAALPSLAAARGAFVARLVHRDEASWSAALDDLIRWHAACRDDGATWPGRAGQEALVDAAGGVPGGTRAAGAG